MQKSKYTSWPILSQILIYQLFPKFCDTIFESGKNLETAACQQKPTQKGGYAVAENKGTEGYHFSEKSITEKVSLLFLTKSLLSGMQRWLVHGAMF